MSEPDDLLRRRVRRLKRRERRHHRAFLAFKAEHQRGHVRGKGADGQDGDHGDDGDRGRRGRAGRDGRDGGPYDDANVLPIEATGEPERVEHIEHEPEPAPVVHDGQDAPPVRERRRREPKPIIPYNYRTPKGLRTFQWVRVVGGIILLLLAYNRYGPQHALEEAACGTSSYQGGLEGAAHDAGAALHWLTTSAPTVKDVKGALMGVSAEAGRVTGEFRDAVKGEAGTTQQAAGMQPSLAEFCPPCPSLHLDGGFTPAGNLPPATPNVAARAALAAGFRGENAVVAVAVAGAESNYVADATNTNSDSYSSVDYGMWQINGHWHPEILTMDWRDPFVNAQEAYKISGGGTWSAWHTYTSGAYLAFMDKARAAVEAEGGTATTVQTVVDETSSPDTSSPDSAFCSGTLQAGDTTSSSTDFSHSFPGAQEAIEFATKQLGDPYVYGAEGPNSWDCSGLTMMAWRAAGINLPRTADAQHDWATPVPAGQEQPGDLLFSEYNTRLSGAWGHVMLVIGPGKAIAAPYTGVDVRYETYDPKDPDIAFGRVH